MLGLVPLDFQAFSVFVLVHFLFALAQNTFASSLDTDDGDAVF